MRLAVDILFVAASSLNSANEVFVEVQSGRFARVERLTQECSRFRVVDAKGEVVGRLASRIAMTLMGKDKPTYVPRNCDGDAVIVLNASQVELTGNKWEKKLYRWHTGYPGGLKERSAADQHARDPTKVLREAVMGMLPKNLLRKTMSRRLRIYAGEEHEFEGAGAELVPFPEGKPRRMNRRPIPLEPGFFPMNPEAYQKRGGVITPEAVAAREQL